MIRLRVGTGIPKTKILDQNPSQILSHACSIKLKSGTLETGGTIILDISYCAFEFIGHLIDTLARQLVSSIRINWIS